MRFLVILLALSVATSASAFDARPVNIQMMDGFPDSTWDCYTPRYWYIIPCDAASWAWAISGWQQGDIIGQFSTIGERGLDGQTCPCPSQCWHLNKIRVLDLQGWGTTYPGLYTIKFNVYCADENGCVVGPSLWNSGPIETRFGWNFIYVDRPLALCSCFWDPDFGPRFLITVTMVGSRVYEREWYFDNISAPVQQGCYMHDISCWPALYPRPYNSYFPVMHTGYYGNGTPWQCPEWFKDPGDTTPYGTLYGHIELTGWRAYLSCFGPTETEESSWGRIKAIYR